MCFNATRAAAVPQQADSLPVYPLQRRRRDAGIALSPFPPIRDRGRIRKLAPGNDRCSRKCSTGKIRRAKPGIRRLADAKTAESVCFQQLHPKCANPACPTAFRWLEGVKVLPLPTRGCDVALEGGRRPTLLGIHGVEHYWLCERCSHVFTLVFEEDQGVVLKLRHLEIASGKAPSQLSAS